MLTLLLHLATPNQKWPTPMPTFPEHPPIVRKWPTDSPEWDNIPTTAQTDPQTDTQTGQVTGQLTDVWTQTDTIIPSYSTTTTIIVGTIVGIFGVLTIGVLVFYGCKRIRKSRQSELNVGSVESLLIGDKDYNNID